MPESHLFKLSICVATLNRAALIGETLESIVSQATDACEIVVLDGASTDDTERVVAEYARRFNHLRYVRQDRANGIDRDFDRAIELAQGEYCWVKSDDDPLKPGALAAVLEALRQDLSVVLINAEFRDPSLSTVLWNRWAKIHADRLYGPEEMDRLLADTGYLSVYIGSSVIKRAIWLAREREPYYGSLHVSFAVIFQDRLPGMALVIAEPFVVIRYDNARWWSKWFEIFMFDFPSLVWTLALPDSAKRELYESAEPWRDFRLLLLYRAQGAYSMAEYRRLIRPRLRSAREALIPVLVAALPGMLVNIFVTWYYSVAMNDARGILLLNLRKSSFHPSNWRPFSRMS